MDYTYITKKHNKVKKHTKKYNTKIKHVKASKNVKASKHISNTLNIQYNKSNKAHNRHKVNKHTHKAKDDTDEQLKYILAEANKISLKDLYAYNITKFSNQDAIINNINEIFTKTKKTTPVVIPQDTNTSSSK